MKIQHNKIYIKNPSFYGVNMFRRYMLHHKYRYMIYDLGAEAMDRRIDEGRVGGAQVMESADGAARIGAGEV